MDSSRCVLYQNHFQLHAMPFAVSPDSVFLYESAQHSAALTMLEFAMESQAPFCLLTGEIGSGKTTLIRRLLRIIRDQPVTVGLVSHSHDRFRSIHSWALSALSIVYENDSEIGQFEALNDFFLAEYRRGRRTVLIFDEAQNLSVRTLEELRLLSNVNADNVMALQIILVGQPELRRKLELPELEQFAQRVSIDFHLGALTLPEVEAYVRHRLTVAGGSNAIFDRQSLEIIHQRTHGIPRIINQLCNLCLVYAYAAGVQQVTAATVAEVIKDRSRGYSSRPTAATLNGASSSGGTAAASRIAITKANAPPTASNGAGSPSQHTPVPPVAAARPMPAPRAEPSVARASNGQQKMTDAAAPRVTAAPTPIPPAARQAVPSNGVAKMPDAAIATSASAAPITINTPAPAGPTVVPVTQAVAQTIVSLAPLANAAITTDDPEEPVARPPKIGRLPLTIGQPQPKGKALPLKIPIKPEIGTRLPLKQNLTPVGTDSLQLKKGRSKAHRSWFFFS